MTDPVLGERVLHIQRRVPLPEAEHLDNLDGILISHALETDVRILAPGESQDL